MTVLFRTVFYITAFCPLVFYSLFLWSKNRILFIIILKYYCHLPQTQLGDLDLVYKMDHCRKYKLTHINVENFVCILDDIKT